MRTRLWRLSLFLPVILLLMFSSALAQDTISLDGSDTLQPLVERLTASYNESAPTPLAFTLSANGPNTAFTDFCNGTVNGVMSTRYMSDAEKTQCDTSGITFVENLLGYEALVVLVSPSLGGDTPLTCVSLDELNLVYGFSAEGKAGDLQLLNPLTESSPMTIYAPNADTGAFSLLQALLPDGQARTDLTFYTEPNEVVGLLNSVEGAGIAVLTYAQYTQLEDSTTVTALSIRDPFDQVCHAPTLGNLETGVYQAQRPLMLYFNQAILPAVLPWIASISENKAAVPVLEELGFTAGSDATYARNMNNALEPITGRTFSRPDAPVTITNAATGEITVGGSPLVVDLVKTMTSNFSASYPGATLKLNLRGDVAAWQALCDGTADAAFTTTPASAEQLAACESNSIGTYDVPVGSQGVVFVVAKKNATLPTCLDVNTLANIFAVPATENPAEIPSGTDRDYTVGPQNWQELNASYPDLPLFVLMSGQSSLEIDWLLNVAGITDRWGRSDKENNVYYGDPRAADQDAYRAAGVANYEGGAITVLPWSAYQNSERMADLTLLEVDAGNGCVAPSVESITSGAYPLAYTVNLTFARPAMKNDVVAAFMWDMLSDPTIRALEELKLVALNADQMRQSREAVFGLIEEALAQAAQEAAAEATAEATGEATQEATSAATAEATEAPTAEATVEATEAATVEPTAEATVEATEAATVEPTAEATAEPTAEATVEATEAVTEAPTAEATAEPTAEPTATRSN